MPLIKCIDCGKMISDRVEACPNCGCPVPISIEESKKAEKETAEKKAAEERAQEERKRPQPLEKMDLDLMQVKKDITERIAPLFEDAWKVQDVQKSLWEFFDGFADEVSSNAPALLKDVFNNLFEKIKESNKHRARKRMEDMQDHLQVYRDIQSKEYEGLGFSIITSSPLSAIAYAALDAHDAGKFYRKQTEAANKYLFDYLNSRKNDSSPYELDLRNILHGIDLSVIALGEMVRARNVLSEQFELYANTDQLSGNAVYEQHKDIFAVLKSAYQKKEFISSVRCGSEEEGQYIKADTDGYMFTFVPYLSNNRWFFTTGKLEKEIIQERHYQDHPEERALQKAAASTEIETLYHAAEEALSAGKYYAAATSFAKCGGYLDATERSIRIWADHILSRSFLHGDTSDPRALTENGTIVTNATYVFHNREKQNTSFSHITKWDNVISFITNRPFNTNSRILALKDNGTVMYYDCLYERRNYGGNEISVPKVHVHLFPDDYAPWKGVKQIVCESNAAAALFTDGTVRYTDYEGKPVEGTDTAGAWKDIKKIDLYSDLLVGLTNDGKVLAAGKATVETGTSYRAWKNISDIVASFHQIYGLTRDGTVVSSKKWYNPAIKNLTNVVRIGLTKDTINGKMFAVSANGDLILDSSVDKIVRSVQKYEGIVSTWKNVVMLATTLKAYIGLKTDGTVVTTDKVLDVSAWTDIVEIDSTQEAVYGLRSDGTILCAGEDEHHTFDQISSWKLFDGIDEASYKLDHFAEFKHERELQKALSDAESELERTIQSGKEVKGLFAKKKVENLEKKAEELRTKIEELKKQLSEVKS